MEEEKEDEEEHGILSAETLSLPGLGESEDEKEQPDDEEQPDEQPDAEVADGSDKATKGSDDQEGAKKRNDSLRTVYWSVVHEAQKKLKKQFPDMPAKEILKKAKEQWSYLNKS